MGLDITAYKNLKEVENPQIDEYGELANWKTEWIAGDSMKWSETHFPGRGEGVNPDKVYTFKDRFSFRAGSYSGYGIWRQLLSELSDGESFGELIDFADNEGVIGSVVSKKLYKDFVENKARAVEFAEKMTDGSWWLNSYDDWEKAFELASENGAVDFR